jgi:CMP-N,N'-diacetyllegionaminic acid synthase
MVLGLIPARGGSKGVPGKNIKTVIDKPLIAYAIACGLNCPSIDHLIVSTDSPQIADISKKWGADVPFLRPEKIAGDTTPMLPVMQHAVTESERLYRKRIEALVLLDPTGPLRTVGDIESCLKQLRETDCDAVVSGSPAHRNPYFNMVVMEGGYIRLPMGSGESVGCRQQAPRMYDLNTVVWVYTRRALMDEGARLPKRTGFYEVPGERSLDLDSEFDFTLLEFLMSL